MEQRERTYRQVAENLGLTWHAARVPFAGRGAGVSGAFRGFRVRTDEFVGRKRRCVRVTVDGVGTNAGSVPVRLELDRERTSIGMIGGEDVVVGDPRFDERVRVRGGEAVALAALGREARSALLTAIIAGDEIRVRAGMVIAELEFNSRPDPTQLIAVTRRAVRVARHLVVSANGIPAALAERALKDPLPGVRLQALEALARLEGEGALARRVARGLLSDKDPEVRLRAAVAAGREGFDTLVALVRARSGRGRSRGPRRWGSGLAEALDRSREGNEGRRARALDHLVARYPAAWVRPLLHGAVKSGPGPLRVAALRGVARIGDASFQSEVLRLLDHPTDAVRDAAVAALGAVGTVAAVPALRALAARSGSLEFPVRRAVDTAVAAIQSRISGAAAGQVSLADTAPVGGEVSLAGGTGDAAGRLSAATQG